MIRNNTVKSRRLRVCFVIDDLGVGGTESQLLALINTLDRMKVQPYLSLLHGDKELLRDLEPLKCPIMRLHVRSLYHPSNSSPSLAICSFFAARTY